MPDWMQSLVPDALRDFLSPGVVAGLLIFSLVAFVGTLLFVPWFFRRIPPDHYIKYDRPSLPFVAPGSWLQPVAHVVKNLAGVCLIAMGLAMLVLPGQGLLTMAIGILLVDFPGKRRFERWLVSRPFVSRGINRLRERAGQPPLQTDDGKPASS